MSFHTIAAIATAQGSSGVSIIRLSGGEAISIADKIFIAKNKIQLSRRPSHTLTYGNIFDLDGRMIDEVLVSVMRAPNSYTKEDVVEINCHGGMFVTKKILETALQTGATLAQPGEFTKRAFLNGRIDLSQAEAVIDLINAMTEVSAEYAVSGLDGKIYNKIKFFMDEILKMAAHLEAAIDYPEHDLEGLTAAQIYQNVQSILLEMEEIYKSSSVGKIIREGLHTVILGKPNTGKSSLLNALLKEDRAIVTDTPGTTRDILFEYYNIDGLLIKIFDTAGIRETEDAIEEIGVYKAKEYAKSADLILFMMDNSKEISKEDLDILQMIKGKPIICLVNKCDLPTVISFDKIYEMIAKENVIPFSAKCLIGLDRLTEKIKQVCLDGAVNASQRLIIGNVRHKNALFNAIQSLKAVLETIDSHMPEDFISMDLQTSYQSLGEITGETLDEDIIDKIFSEFCLGK